MKITHANERKPEFVTKHEVGKVYVDNLVPYLFVGDVESKKCYFVNLNFCHIETRYASLEDADKNNTHDILVDCELVIKGE